jgi:ParB family chromosome partitioning protein
MSRKNILANITGAKLTAVNPAEGSATPSKAPPLAFAGRGALGAVTRTIDDLAARADAARDIEKRLTAGEMVVDLDPSTIDGSFVSDRLALDDDDFKDLVEAIRTRGQDSPILVRPHPEAPGRFQVAFGHRRLRAARQVGRPVRAVVKVLSDRDLVLAQGQENSARANLSFIERALFARRLEEAGHDRETIMSALRVDKTMVSRMISVATRLPTPLIEAIGAAPGTGRSRWIELSDAFQAEPAHADTAPLLTSAAFLAAGSDERFNLVLAHFQKGEDPSGAPAASKRPRPTTPRDWAAPDGTRIARVAANERTFSVTIDARAAPGFGDYLLSRMDTLYAGYAKQNKQNKKE